MSEATVHIITSDDVDRYAQYSQLVLLLPTRGGKPQPMRCEKCGAYLGCVANNAGLAVGHFHRQGNEWSRLIGSALISQGTISLKCACRFVTHWRIPR